MREQGRDAAYALWLFDKIIAVQDLAQLARDAGYEPTGNLLAMERRYNHRMAKSQKRKETK